MSATEDEAAEQRERRGDGSHDDAEEGLAPWYGRTLLGLGLIAIGIAALYALIAIWPAVDAATRKPATQEQITVFGIRGTPSGEVSLLLLVTFASALGSSLHAAISFTDYVGNQRLHSSWLWWYSLRTFVGVALAILFYFALRGGFFSTSVPTDVINPYGIGAIAGLVGLFSKQATDKLREIFDTMFRTAPGHGDDQRSDGIVNPRPVIAGVEPAQIAAGTETITVTISGEGFIPRSLAQVSRSGKGKRPFLGRATRFVDAGRLDVALVRADLARAGALSVSVFNPGPGGGRSGTAEVEVVAPGPGAEDPGAG